jgi:hypothetical protein
VTLVGRWSRSVEFINDIFTASLIANFQKFDPAPGIPPKGMMNVSIDFNPRGTWHEQIA